MTFRKRLVVASLPQYSPASSLGIDIDEERDDSLVSSSITYSHDHGSNDHSVSGKRQNFSIRTKKIVVQLAFLLVFVVGLYYFGFNGNSEIVNEGKATQPPISSSENLKPPVHNGLKTSEWEKFDSYELKQYFGCNQLFKTPRPLITKRNWVYFRDLYNQYVKQEQSTINNVDTTHQVSAESSNFPVLGAFTTDKGRGLVASRDIKRGELIFTGTNNTIVFDTGHSWRKFLWYLYHAPPTPDHYPEGFACDIRAWSWIQALPNEKGSKIVVDIDESSLLNQPSKGERANIQCGKLDDKNAECELDYYARVDIKKGDEILCRYSDFAAQGGWQSFGL